MPHWLTVLSFFPETFNPYTYQNLLPECDQEGRLLLIFKRELRCIDWVERIEFSKVLKSNDDNETPLIYETHPSLLVYK